MKYVVCWTRPDLGTVFHSFQPDLTMARSVADGVRYVAKEKGQRSVKVHILKTTRVK